MLPFHSVLVRGLLAVGALAFSSTNAATLQTSAAISNFQYRLVDLDPSDGITPALNITWSRTWSYSVYGNQYSSDAVRDEIRTFGTTSVSEPLGTASTTAAAFAFRSASTLNTLAPQY